MLSDVILEIADEMQQWVDGSPDTRVQVVASWAKQLRRAVQAAEGAGGNLHPLASPLLLSPEAQHRKYIDEARAEFRKRPRQPDEAGSPLPAEEGGEMKQIIGGPAGGTEELPSYVMAPANLKEGDKTIISGAVYELRGGVIRHKAE